MVTPATNNLPPALVAGAAAQERASNTQMANLTMEASVAQQRGDLVRFEQCLTEINNVSRQSFRQVHQLSINEADAAVTIARLQRTCDEQAARIQNLTQHHTRVVDNLDEAADAALARARARRGTTPEPIPEATFDAADATAPEVPAVTWRERVAAYAAIARERLEQAWPYIRTGARIAFGIAGFVVSVIALTRGGGGGASFEVGGEA